MNAEEIDAIASNYVKDKCIESIKRLEGFEKELWRDAIDKQISVEFEELWYHEKDPNRKYISLFEHWDSMLDSELPWQDVTESEFATAFLIIKDKDKSLVLSYMFGQGIAVSICNEQSFKDWMKQCENKFTYDKSKCISIDDLSKTVNEVIEKCKSYLNGK